MANEIRIQASLQINKGELVYQSQPSAFQADMNTGKGPSPGVLIVPTSGRDVYFTELTTPGYCRLMNLDDTNYVEVGIKDPQSNLFYPLLELPAGESFIVKLSRNLQEQYAGSGTGTTTPENYLRLKANKATCNVLVEAFEAA